MESYLEDHPRTCKWLGSPPFINHILLMEEILHHLGCIKPCKKWDNLPINWCRISSINSIKDDPTSISMAGSTQLVAQLVTNESPRPNALGQGVCSGICLGFLQKTDSANSQPDEIFGDYIFVVGKF